MTCYACGTQLTFDHKCGWCPNCRMWIDRPAEPRHTQKEYEIQALELLYQRSEAK